MSTPFAYCAQSKYEILVFYNKYCHHCKSWLNSTGANYEKDAPKKISTTIPKLLKYDLSERKNMQLYQDMLSSGKLTSSIPGVPAFIIVDENQIEVKRTIGAMDGEEFYRFVNDTINQQTS